MTTTITYAGVTGYTAAAVASWLSQPLPPIRARIVEIPCAPMLPRLADCGARRGAFAPCECCGRITSCWMDPTMGAEQLRPRCMWHGMSDDRPATTPAEATLLLACHQHRTARRNTPRLAFELAKARRPGTALAAAAAVTYALDR